MCCIFSSYIPSDLLKRHAFLFPALFVVHKYKKCAKVRSKIALKKEIPSFTFFFLLSFMSERASDKGEFRRYIHIHREDFPSQA